MPKPTDISSPAYHGAQALRAAADAYGGPLQTREWLRKRANMLHPESDPEGIRLVAATHQLTPHVYTPPTK